MYVGLVEVDVLLLEEDIPKISQFLKKDCPMTMGVSSQWDFFSIYFALWS